MTSKRIRENEATPIKTVVGAKAGKRCYLCGRTRKLTKTECCDQWICDDEANYKLFSYARNSCSRNHRRFTLCSHHATEHHPGDWQTCLACREGFETEMYVWYGTNEYNIEKLKNPPSYEPTKCARCGVVISSGEGGYSIRPSGKSREYWCEECSAADFKRSSGRLNH